MRVYAMSAEKWSQQDGDGGSANVVVHQTESYDADDEKRSSLSSLTLRKKIRSKRKKSPRQRSDSVEAPRDNGNDNANPPSPFDDHDIVNAKHKLLYQEKL